MGPVGAAIAIGAAVAGAATSIQAQRAQAKAQKNAIEFNQKIEAQNALAEKERITRRQRQLRGQSLARLGKSGILLEGSPLEVFGDQAAVFESDRLQIDRDRAISGALAESRTESIDTQTRFQTASAIFGLVGKVAGGSSGGFGGSGQPSTANAGS